MLEIATMVFGAAVGFIFGWVLSRKNSNVEIKVLETLLGSERLEKENWKARVVGRRQEDKHPH